MLLKLKCIYFADLVKTTAVMSGANRSVYEENLKIWLRQKENATECYKFKKLLENSKNRQKGSDNTEER